MTRAVRISHYELLEAIGAKGPAELYRARDTRLGRDVAVKLLRSEALTRADTLERFRREAHIAALVTHPHICTVHDSGEEGGHPYLVLELLEGRALDQTIDGAPLAPERVIDIGVQLADALGAAHRRGVVHGNLQPSNVFITSDGHVKLLELGAALSSQGVFENTKWMTTPIAVPSITTVDGGKMFHPYESPEQISGSVVDERSDVFAAGALLYEMATGTRAFAGKTGAEIGAQIAERTPPRPRTIAPGVPATIEAIVERAMEKDPARRYQTATDLRDDLLQARRSVDARSPAAPPRNRDRGLRAAAAAAFGFAGLLVATFGWWWQPAGAGPTVERSTLLVSHIANGTADPDFDGTLRQAVTVYLAQTPYLDVVSDERIRGTLQLMGRDAGEAMTHDVAAEVCQRLGLQAMLEGSVSAVGRSTVVALIATDCAEGATIVREQVEVARKEDVLHAIGLLTATIRRSLGESGVTLARHNVPIEEATTPSIEALKAYTEAVARRADGREIEAVKLLERAIAFDAQFALAYATLSSIFGGFGETGRSEEYARLAFTYRSRVSERERLFITYQYHDRVTGDELKAREALEVWKASYPRDYRPANALAVLLNRVGDYAGAAKEASEAIRRNPAHAFPRSNLAHAHRGSGRFAEARAVVDEALARNLETAPMRRLLYQLAQLEGNDALARAQIDWAAGRTRSFDMTGARAQVAAFNGRIAEARSLYAETAATATERGFLQVASGYTAQAALTEALYGYSREAIARGREVLSVATANEPQLKAATALALAGAPAEADAVIRRMRETRPEAMQLHGIHLPVAEAAALLARRRFDDATEALRRASPYERGTVAALAPTYLRAYAGLRAGAAQEAAREFRAVIQHRGADPFSPFVPLSQLGYARALARIGATGESRRAYEALLRTWTTADPDLPVLRRAREELSRLR